LQTIHFGFDIAQKAASMPKNDTQGESKQVLYFLKDVSNLPAVLTGEHLPFSNGESQTEKPPFIQITD